MGSRFKSAIAAVIIQAGLAYALIVGLATSFTWHEPDRLTAVNVAREIKAPPPPPVPATSPLPPASLPSRPALRPSAGQPVILRDWTMASPEQRNTDFMKARQWVQDNLPEEERRLISWREELPPGRGPGKVTRLRPPNLQTHTLYWPANWSKGPLPIIAWGNGYDGKCSNSSLPYAAFLSEIASHGYFVVAVGNDDIDYPQPEGLTVLADGRPLRTQASALRKAVDWAVGENGRGGSPYAGKLDPGKIAYMGHGCGGRQALEASSDPRTTTTVLLNASATLRADRAAAAHKAPIAHFEGSKDDIGVRRAGDANFAAAEAAGWPMYKAALEGMTYDGAYAGPDQRWSKAVVAWLDWQLKGDGQAPSMTGALPRGGWSRIEATGFVPEGAP